jgi:DNA mismatch endonuclease, patch repair protein
MGYRYRLHVQSLPGRPDIVFPRAKKVIQVHGCFWHQHKDCPQSHVPKSRLEYWSAKLANNIRRDKANAGKLRSLGWKVLTLWECELSSSDRLSKRLEKFLSGN